MSLPDSWIKSQRYEVTWPVHFFRETLAVIRRFVPDNVTWSASSQQTKIAAGGRNKGRSTSTTLPRSDRARALFTSVLGIWFLARCLHRTAKTAPLHVNGGLAVDISGGKSDGLVRHERMALRCLNPAWRETAVVPFSPLPRGYWRRMRNIPQPQPTAEGKLSDVSQRGSSAKTAETFGSGVASGLRKLKSWLSNFRLVWDSCEADWWFWNLGEAELRTEQTASAHQQAGSLKKWRACW
jgi:hypothetical protein